VKIRSFQDSVTSKTAPRSPSNFRTADIAETKDLDENRVLDLDDRGTDDLGNIWAITVEHANIRADIPQFSYEQIVSAKSAD
jgi:hypothetical protein